MKDAGFVFEDHTADVAVRSWGKNLEEVFSQTALALMTTITPNLELITHETSKDLYIEAEDKEALLFDFLSEFLFIFDVEDLVFNEIKVIKIIKDKEKYTLDATVKGEIFDKNKHEIGTEVKAITYSFMTIEESEDKIEIKIVFDV